MKHPFRYSLDHDRPLELWEVCLIIVVVGLLFVGVLSLAPVIMR